MTSTVADKKRDKQNLRINYGGEGEGPWRKLVPGKQHPNLWDLGKLWGLGEGHFDTGSSLSVVSGHHVNQNVAFFMPPTVCLPGIRDNN